jgi:hypothetical protein
LYKEVEPIPIDLLDESPRNVTLRWNKDSSDEVETAAATFTAYLKKGWIAFKVEDNARRIQLHRFSPGLEKIILVQVAEGG